jgi:pteridine reductase
VDVNGKLAVVTGGARRLGRAIAEGLAAEGARVVIHCHESLPEAEALARQIGGEVVQADLARPEGASTLARRVLELGERRELAVWVNAAARFERRGFLDSNDGLWQRTLQLVLLSPAAALRRVAPKMADGGVIINVLDVAAHQAWKGFAHHSVAKSALLMLTRALAVELAPRLRVCGVSPGVVLLPEGASEAEAERLRKKVPLKRLGEPADVADTVCFLVQADYITGSIVTVDGGLTTRLLD